MTVSCLASPDAGVLAARALEDALAIECGTRVAVESYVENCTGSAECVIALRGFQAQHGGAS